MNGSFSVLHLSDIHLKSIDDPIVPLARDIAKRVYYDARDTGVCLILVSGDIAFSGKQAEYEAADLFLNELRDLIEDEGCGHVDILMVPGNHDCELLPEDKSREILIEHVVRTGQVDIGTNVVESCTNAQNAFFKFRSTISRAEPISDHRLWTEYELNVDGTIIRLTALNAAWMSRLPEVNGELVFPIDQFIPILTADADIRIVMLHHPLHWYNSSSFHSLRDAIHLHCDLVISGHEHTQTTIQSEIEESGRCIVIECGALQPHEKGSNSEFLTLRFDAQNQELTQSSHKIVDFTELKEAEVKEISTRFGGRRGTGAQLKDRFLDFLRDPGGNFMHPKKADLTLDDVYVAPIVSDRMRPTDRDVSTEKLIRKDGFQNRVLLTGDEKSGKSTLLRWTFREWHVQGGFPVYIRGEELKTTKPDSFRRAISRAARRQYVDSAMFEEAPVDQRMILIDDIDLLSGGHAALRPLIDYCDKHFSRIFVTASTGYEFSELLDEEAPEALSSFDVFTLPMFGHKIRRRLIQKWCGSASDSSAESLEQTVHRVENLMNTVIGNNLVPAQPIFLLILLQSIDQRQEQDLHHSGFAHYYNYLITKGLGSAGVHPEEIDEIFNYLANLAWSLEASAETELSIEGLSSFNSQFSQKFVSVDFEARKNDLIRAKILVENINESYSFAYPYIRYFFLGKYLAENSENQEVQSKLDEYCETLHLRDRANCILFLMHHRNDLAVVEKIAGKLAECFSEISPLELGKDTRSLNTLVDTSTELVLGEIDVEANQEREREIRDKVESKSRAEPEASVSEEVDAAMEVTIKINSVIKTAEILGQVLKNYYGSIQREDKGRFLKEIFDGPLRMLRFLVNDIVADPENFAHELRRQIRKNKPSMAEMPSEKATRRFAFNLIGTICTGIVTRTASLVSSEKLDEDFQKLIDGSHSTSYRLVVAAIDLMKPGQSNIQGIQQLGKDIRDNNFAFRMLQSLGVYHLRMFHAEEQYKQRICAALRISQDSSKKIKGPARRQYPTKPDKNP